MIRSYSVSQLEVGDKAYLCEQYGWSGWKVTEWTVTKKTPGGQISLKMGDRIIRANKRGSIIGDGTYSRRHFVSPQEAASLRVEQSRKDAWRNIATLAEKLEIAARKEDLDESVSLSSLIASAIEARRAETRSGSVEDESAVHASGDAQ